MREFVTSAYPCLRHVTAFSSDQRLGYEIAAHVASALTSESAAVANRSIPPRDAEQPELPVAFALRVIHEQLQVVQLSRKRVTGERLRLGERFAIASDSASGEIESDRGQSVLGQSLREVRKEAPVGKAFEAVTEDYRSERWLGGVNLAANGQAILARDVERFRTPRADLSHPSTSPSISAHPMNPRAIDATFSYPICFIVNAASAERFPRAQ